MTRILYTTIFALIATLGLQPVAAAEGRVGVVFSKDEVSIIASWYRDHGSVGQKDKRGKRSGSLPPGIAKNLARGKPLPPGIAKQYLPDGLVRVLPAPPHGYERIIVDGRILLVDVATRIIHDVLTDIVFG